MLTPSELYNSYTNNPCTEDWETGGLIGAGTPYDLYKLSTFLKQVKYPCLKNIPGYSGIRYDNTDWKNNICLPYKYLEVLDPQLFSEVQPSVQAGTAHAIRNAADVSRACDLVTADSTIIDTIYDNIEFQTAASGWVSRGSTEYISSFGGNYITNCLFALGPDLVPAVIASGRGTGCDEMDCLPRWKASEQGSALGAGFGCADKEEGGKECTPCRKCDPEDDEDPCCKPGSCAEKMNQCCGDPPGYSSEFIFNPSYPELTFSHGQFETVPPSGRVSPDSHQTIRHIGYLLRKKYDGYANLQDISENFWSCPRDIFLKHIQSQNGYDYELNTEKTSGTKKIKRVRTISYVDSTDDIKALLFNGYGIVLNTNIGFSRTKDSRGLAYPDKIWYHSYAIVGYDDTHTEFNECVFILANSWGDWNSGGDPSWGKLPTGCFLVTESHLKMMLKLERIDKAGCRKRTNVFGDVVQEGCTADNSCIPWECGKNQKPMGMAFVLCFSDSLQKRKFNYKKFILDKHDIEKSREMRLMGQNNESTSFMFDNEEIQTNNIVSDSDNPMYGSVVEVDGKLIYKNTNIENIVSWSNYLTDIPNTGIINKLQSSSSNGFDFHTNTTNSGNANIQTFSSYKNIFNSKETKDHLFHHVSFIDNQLVLKEGSVYSFNSIDANHIISEQTDYSKEDEPSEFLAINTLKTNSIKLNKTSITVLSNEIKNPSIITNIFYFTNCSINININSNIGGIIKGENSEIHKKIYGDLIIEETGENGILISAEIYGNVYLKESKNKGTIYRDAVFTDESSNEEEGIVKGNAYFKDSVNRGIVYGNATFEGETAENVGIVNGRVTFI